MMQNKCDCGGNCGNDEDKNDNCCGRGCCGDNNNFDIMSKSDLLEMKTQLEKDLESVNEAIAKK